jgi:hypothetical protein
MAPVSASSGRKLSQFSSKVIAASQHLRCTIGQLNKWVVSTLLGVRHRVLYFSPVYGRGGANGFQ